VLVAGSKGLACPHAAPRHPITRGGGPTLPSTQGSRLGMKQRLDHFTEIFGRVRFCRLAWLVWLLVLARWCAPPPARGCPGTPALPKRPSAWSRRDARRASSLASGTAAGTPHGHAAPAMRRFTGRRSTLTARRWNALRGSATASSRGGYGHALASTGGPRIQAEVRGRQGQNQGSHHQSAGRLRRKTGRRLRPQPVDVQLRVEVAE